MSIEVDYGEYWIFIVHQLEPILLANPIFHFANDPLLMVNEG